MVNHVNAVSTSSHKTKLARKVVYRENDKEYTIIDKDTMLLDIFGFENCHTLESKMLTLSSNGILAQNPYFSRSDDPK